MIGYIKLSHHLEWMIISQSWGYEDDILDGGIPTPLKNMKVNWDHYSRYMEKIKAIFQTTNQYIIEQQEMAQRRRQMSATLRSPWAISRMIPPFPSRRRE